MKLQTVVFNGTIALNGQVPYNWASTGYGTANPVPVSSGLVFTGEPVQFPFPPPRINDDTYRIVNAGRNSVVVDNEDV